MSQVHICELRAPDLEHGFLETLQSLTDVGLRASDGSTVLKANEIFAARLAGGVKTYVAGIADAVVGTVSIVPDVRFIYADGLVYHLEDVAVHKDHQSNAVGGMLVDHAIEQARVAGAYKIVLNCY